MWDVITHDIDLFAVDYLSMSQFGSFKSLIEMSKQEYFAEWSTKIPFCNDMNLHIYTTMCLLSP